MSPSRRVMLGGLVAILALAACGGGDDEASRSAPATTAASPRPIVVDTDLGVDDVIALAVLLGDPRVDVRAVTVPGTGLVRCPIGVRHVRSLLAEFGRKRLVGCGRRDAGADGLDFPAPWRADADRLYGLDLRGGGDGGGEQDAAAVLETAITSSRGDVTIVALGPWTNLEDLAARNPAAAGKVARIHAMAGAIDVPGNAEVGGAPRAEWNVRADPSAVAAVLGTEIPVTLIPLDATNSVPLTRDFLDRLAGDRSADGASLAWRLLSTNPFLISGGLYLWDALAAIALLDPSLVRTERLRLDVDTSGPDAGRIARSEAGRDVQTALGADGARAVDAIIEALGPG